MSIVLDIIVGTAAIAGLVYVGHRIRQNTISAERGRALMAEQTRIRQKKTWDELTGYPDVRKLRSVYERQNHAPSYFDHVDPSKEDGA